MIRGRAPGAGPTIVVGFGNPLMTDDGIGLAALARLTECWELPDDVVPLDGGIWGLRLLPEIEEAGRLLLLDAIDAGLAPGTVIELEADAIPRFFEAHLSPHQVGVRDLLALATLRGTLPAETVAMGIQPFEVELSAELSPVTSAALDALVGRAVRRLEGWGHRVRPREDAEAAEAACTR